MWTPRFSASMSRCWASASVSAGRLPEGWAVSSSLSHSASAASIQTPILSKSWISVTALWALSDPLRKVWPSAVKADGPLGRLGQQLVAHLAQRGDDLGVCRGGVDREDPLPGLVAAHQADGQQQVEGPRLLGAGAESGVLRVQPAEGHRLAEEIRSGALQQREVLGVSIRERAGRQVGPPH